MYIVHHADSLPPAFVGGAAVTIGNFDGVHLGHQLLVEQVTEYARAKGMPSAVITFEPHPLCVILGDAAPPLLMSLERKLSCLAGLGVDLALVLPFSPAMAATSPETFTQAVLVERLHTRRLFVGYDYAFGKGRRGNAALLASLGAQAGPEQGFVVEQIAPVYAEGSIVSSTRIREDILAGVVDEAARLLGRPHSVEGIVAHGAKRGGPLLGFPTANLRIAENLVLPKAGVYAVLAELYSPGADEQGCVFPPPGGTFFRGVSNVGKNPTFGDAALRVETHLLDFHQDIYNAPLRIHFVHRLRDEQKFPGVDALKEQIGRDIIQARDILR
jgi:riboflavin kinase/FMN adenylyltransferase